jgi:hypothetical protein
MLGTASPLLWGLLLPCSPNAPLKNVSPAPRSWGDPTFHLFWIIENGDPTLHSFIDEQTLFAAYQPCK